MSLLLGDQLNKYRTLFNPFYFGITSTVQNIIRDYNISNPLLVVKLQNYRLIII